MNITDWIASLIFHDSSFSKSTQQTISPHINVFCVLSVNNDKLQFHFEQNCYHGLELKTFNIDEKFANSSVARGCLFSQRFNIRHHSVRYLLLKKC